MFAGIGLEYCYNKLFSLRSGYSHYGESIGLSTLSLGVGLNIKGFAVDFSWLLSDNLLKNNYAITCSWSLF